MARHAPRAASVVVPGPLAPGARIAVVAPGSAFDLERLEAGLDVLRAWGYAPVEAPRLRAQRGDLAGTDEERAADLAWAFAAPDVDAIWAARGGWGAPRLLGRVDFGPLLARPRWLIGFSDLTALLAPLAERGLAGLYAPLVTELADEERYDAADLRRALTQPAAPRTLEAAATLAPGVAEGRLAGGCLSLLAALAGTPWQPDLRGCVVFVEEVGEKPYRIDRLFWQLAASGALDGIAGLALGHFVNCEAPPGVRRARRLSDVLEEVAARCGVPAVAGLPVGHGPGTRTLPLGFDARLDAGTRVLRLDPPR